MRASPGEMDGLGRAGEAAGPRLESTRSLGEFMPEYHKGGIVRKTGPARLLKGEKVLSRKQVRQASGRSRGGR